MFKPLLCFVTFNKLNKFYLDHLVTPLSLTLPRHSTRRNSEGLLQFTLEPKHVYHRRKSKLASRRILENLRSESILNIHLLFVDPQSSDSPTSMHDLFKPLDFTAIVVYPHQIPDKAIEKVPSFHGNDAIISKSRLFFSRSVMPSGAIM